MNNCVSTLGECDCICHIMEGVKHAMACCSMCPRCNKRITTLLYSSHIESCIVDESNHTLFDLFEAKIYSDII